jgi:hypothetical protein
VNLHHFLYEEASLHEAKTKPRRLKPELSSDASTFSSLSLAEQKDWNASVSNYESNLVDRDLLMDPDMIRMKDRLEDLDAAATLRDSQLDANLSPEFLKTRNILGPNRGKSSSATQLGRT